MYQNPIAPAATVAGIAVLPNTGGNEMILIASIITIVAGLAVIVTTAYRQASKKANRI